MAADATPYLEEIESLEAVEQRYLGSALARLGGNKEALAQRLGISRRTIDRKFRKARDLC